MKKLIACLIIVSLFFLMQSKEITSLVHAQEKQPKLDIVLVLDNSGSMRKNDPQFLARDIVTKFLTDLDEYSRLGMVIFDRQATLAVNLMEATSQDAKNKIIEGLDKVNYAGQFSDSPAAIERAIYELKKHGRKDAGKVIIFLTDGIVDTGDKLLDLEKGKWLKEELTQESKKAEIRIIGIAFSDAADFSLIQTLALKTGGEYFRAYRAEDIQNIFEQINELITKPVTKPLSLTTAAREPIETAPPTIKTATPIPPPVKTLETTPPAIEPKDVTLKEAPLPQKPDFSIPYTLAGIFLLLGAIVVIMIFNRRSSIKADSEVHPPMPRAVLVDLTNVIGNKTLVLNKRINKIGRDPNNDITIPRNTVSSLHATIEYKDGFFFLEDQRSKNKTILSGEEIEPNSPKKLKSGDEIKFNIHKFRFILPDLIPAGKTEMDFHAASETLMRKGPPESASSASSRIDPSIPKAMLIDVENITGKKTMPLDKTLNKIGRGSGNDIKIPKDTISGFHATIEYKDGFFYLEDQRSKNKTRLHGQEMGPNSPKKLKHGDEIMFDVYGFVFLLEQ